MAAAKNPQSDETISGGNGQRRSSVEMTGLDPGLTLDRHTALRPCGPSALDTFCQICTGQKKKRGVVVEVLYRLSLRGWEAFGPLFLANNGHWVGAYHRSGHHLLYLSNKNERLFNLALISLDSFMNTPTLRRTCRISGRCRCGSG